MKFFMIVILLLVIVYNSYRFVQFLIKMKQNLLLPTTKEEMRSIRKYPQKPVEVPTYSNHKVGIILYFLMLLFLLVMLIIGMVDPNIEWSFYLLIFLPLSYSHNLLDVFAVIEDGLLSGSRFIAWKKMKSFYFVPIDTNHKYYGYEKEVNYGYELKIKTAILPISCIVTSDEMKEKISDILNEHGLVNKEIIEKAPSL